MTRTGGCTPSASMRSILNDAKSSTYKLALLRTLCRIAEGSAGLAREMGDDHVALPLGMVALIWLRLYVPLLRHDLPQSPANRRRGETLSFARTGLRALLGSHRSTCASAATSPETSPVPCAARCSRQPTRSPPCRRDT